MNTMTKRTVKLMSMERALRKKTTTRAMGMMMMKKKEAISVPVRRMTETNETKPPHDYARVHISPGYNPIKPGAH